jgi:hypothetical protein
MLYILGFLLVPLLLVLTDPDLDFIDDVGPFATVVNYLVYLVRIFLLLAVFHVGRKLLFDYGEADFKNLLSSAIQDGHAGHASIAMGLAMIAIALVIMSVMLVG